jgi:pyruvate formate lyase activating enzyme
MHEAQYWEKREKGVAACVLCPHHCVLKEGAVGLCGARMNHGGQLVSLNYGRVSSLSMDPVEKKPLRRFMPGTMTLSAGSFGCNLRCPYCQNYTIACDVPETEYVPPDQMAQLARKESAPTVSFTYNEPLVGYEWVMDAARSAQEQDIGIILVTNGYIEPAPLDELLPYVSAMNIDLKAFRDETYRRICGGSLEPVKHTIEAAAAVCHVEVTCLLVTGMHTEEEMADMFDWLSSVDREMPLHLSRYFPRYRYHEPPTDPDWMKRMAALAGEKLSYVYLGNI